MDSVRCVMLAGLLMLTAELAFLPWSTHLPQLLVDLDILSIGDGAVTPMLAVLLSFASPVKARGETLGVMQVVAGLARVIGPLAGGSVFALGGPKVPFLMSSALAVLAALLAVPPGAYKQQTCLAETLHAVQPGFPEEEPALTKEQ